ncbi:hypothetical protein [Stigmatella hybrida]|nr:hypothetical protein [Stigmatella hybrida]
MCFHEQGSGFVPVSQALARLRDEAACRIISGAGLLSLAAE